MSDTGLVLIDEPALLEFKGPDAVRYLNGQLTQDVRRVAGGEITLPSCVTDAKGRLQFRVWITESPEGTLWVEGPAGSVEALEARLTRYLIADDVEVANLTGKYRLIHLIGKLPEAPADVIVRTSRRYHADGADWWYHKESVYALPVQAFHLHGNELEDFRIRHGVPVWGGELHEGLLPPEAGLDATDISYDKGCYIGQEVISRIKHAGKVNKRLSRLDLDAEHPAGETRLHDSHGKDVGEITSISPVADAGVRPALGYVKRGAEQVFLNGRRLRVIPL